MNIQSSISASRQDAAEAFDRLFQLEFGCPYELAARFALIGSLAVLIYLDTGWTMVWVWFGLTVLFHGLLLAFHKARRARITRTDYGIVAALHLCMLTNFVWMPWCMLARGPISAKIAGCAILIGAVAWHARRADTSRFLIWGQSAVLVISGAMAVAHGLPEDQSTAGLFAATAAVSGMVLVVTTTMYRMRHERVLREERSLSEAKAQRLQALGRLSGGVAHDFNNVLTATVGNLELYKELNSKRDQDQCIEDALVAANSGGAIVRKLLSFGREEPASMPQHMHLAQAVETLTSMSRGLMPENILLTIDAPVTDFVLPVSEEDFTAATLNILLNARDTMPDGGALDFRISERTLERAKMMLDGRVIPSGNYIAVEIRDTGPGMPHHVLERVLEPMYTTKPQGIGSGLGLPMAADFARKAGGGLLIETAQGGTRVTLFMALESRASFAPPDVQISPVP